MEKIMIVTTEKAVSSEAVQNNHGSAVDLGNPLNEKVYLLDNVNSALRPLQNGVFASTVVEGENADKAVSAGEFAYNMGQGKSEGRVYKMVAARVSDTIGGVANDFLTHINDDPSWIRNPAKREKTYTYQIATAIRAGQWNAYLGEFDPAVTVSDDPFWSPVDGSSATSTDVAAQPTQACPGKLVYLGPGGKLPVSECYDAKTVW
jgi:hypothetical protein